MSAPARGCTSRFGVIGFQPAISPAFPGLTAIALVGFALGRKDVRADPRLRMCAIVGLGCAIVFFLPMGPFYPVLHRMPRQFHLSAMYMLNSTRHWRRILNGYSGFRPSSYDRAYNAAKGFPSASSLMALHGLGVTHIVVHMEAFCELAGPGCRDELSRTASLEQLAGSGDIQMYRLW